MNSTRPTRDEDVGQPADVQAAGPEAWTERYAGLVRRTAYGLIRGKPGNIDVDDLIQVGMIGLLEAGERYTDRGDASFATYATYRIRGAMLDYLRKPYWGPRLTHRRLRDIEQARRRVEVETNGLTKPAAIAGELGIPLTQYYRTLDDAGASKLLSLDRMVPSEAGCARDELVDDHAGPAEELEQEQRRRAVSAAMDSLPENERVILLLYYEEECLFREIGDRFAISESRVCQIHKQAIERLRSMMQRLDRGQAI